MTIVSRDAGRARKFGGVSVRGDAVDLRGAGRFIGHCFSGEIAVLILAVALALASPASGAQESKYYLPDAAASRVVTVTKSGPAEAAITILTQAVAEKEDDEGGKRPVCQIYAFNPSLIVVRRDEPTSISFRNYQADDEHDFMLVGPDSSVLMFEPLPVLVETSYVFTFHQEGLFSFYCTLHQPEMSGQILVVPPIPHPGANRHHGASGKDFAPTSKPPTE
jgi:plastocyanin